MASLLPICSAPCARLRHVRSRKNTVIKLSPNAMPVQDKPSSMADAAASPTIEQSKTTGRSYSQAAGRGVAMPTRGSQRLRAREEENSCHTSPDSVRTSTTNSSLQQAGIVRLSTSQQSKTSLMDKGRQLLGLSSPNDALAVKQHQRTSSRETQHEEGDKLEQSMPATEGLISENAFLELKKEIKRLDRQGEEQENDWKAYLQWVQETHQQEIGAIRKFAEQKVRNAVEDIDVLTKTNSHLNKYCKDSEIELQTLRAQVKKMQEGAFRTVEAEHWAPESVSDIDRKLKSILNDVKQWSEKYATFDLQHVTEPDRFEQIGKLLRQEKCTSSPQLVRECIASHPSMQKKPGRAAALLLTSLTSSFALRYITGNPFFAFVGKKGDDILKEEQGANEKAMFEKLLAIDPAGAHSWRCQLFRLLDPPVADKGSAAENAKHIAEASRNAAASDCAECLLGWVVDLLIPRADVRAATPGLERIFMAVARLSWTFQTRKQNVKVGDIKSMRPRASRDGVLRYTSSSPAVDVHPLNDAELESDPEALDGREVVLLYYPAVIAFGTSDGQDYDQKQIWRKAVVWLG